MKNLTEQKKRIYKLYVDTLLKGRRITLKEIADELGISRQRVNQQITAMEENGFLIKIKHRKNQPIFIPIAFVEKYNKKDL